jgi:uncharacterized protein YndB with AHSA1/START domain
MDKLSAQTNYAPGPASGARVQKDGEKWTLILVRELHHAPEMVWEALTDPAQLAEWAPFDADRNLAATGPVRMSMARTPKPQVFETVVTRAEAPRLLEYSWGQQNLRWELEPQGDGTRLTLWHNIDNRFIAWGAAGWHICFDVLERMLAGAPVGRIVGGDAMRFGWQRLVNEYATEFGAEAPRWPTQADQNL